ncbi:CRE-BTB-15 protein [Caenorhabditis remanei]|uniref:CRE-BTB-15 protein n=1 Tax=Caenorhabditis remanei TaxID=31234 RepID=E3M7X9_CAERE|nr:CRE-BTB-15 protein [Caenorhabditis remanei]
MSDDLIEYECVDNKVVTVRNRILDTVTTNGVKCVWTGAITNNRTTVMMSFNFDWNELKDQGVDTLEGRLSLQALAEFDPIPGEFHIDLKLSDPNQLVEKKLENEIWCEERFLIWKFSLKPYRLWIENFERMFAPSDKNDGVLVVEGKKLNINKAFLSYHSDFFQALFSTNMIEGKLEEIPIKDVSFKDFGQLLSVIHPDTVFPDGESRLWVSQIIAVKKKFPDKTSEKLLELADRFMMPAVIKIVEYHLLNNSKIENENLMWMADRYEMEMLLEKMIRELDNVVKAKMLKESPRFMDLSDKAKAKILDKIMLII